MKRETTMAFLAGVTVTGAFFAGMGMGSANGSGAIQQVQIVGISQKPGQGWEKIPAELKLDSYMKSTGIPVNLQGHSIFSPIPVTAR